VQKTSDGRWCVVDDAVDVAQQSTDDRNLSITLSVQLRVQHDKRLGVTQRVARSVRVN